MRLVKFACCVATMLSVGCATKTTVASPFDRTVRMLQSDKVPLEQGRINVCMWKENSDSILTCISYDVFVKALMATPQEEAVPSNHADGRIEL